MYIFDRQFTFFRFKTWECNADLNLFFCSSSEILDYAQKKYPYYIYPKLTTAGAKHNKQIFDLKHADDNLFEKRNHFKRIYISPFNQSDILHYF